MTIDALSKFGVKVKFENDNTIEIKGGQKYQSTECNVEGDWSGGAFLLALKMLHEGVDIDGYNKDCNARLPCSDIEIISNKLSIIEVCWALSIYINSPIKLFLSFIGGSCLTSSGIILLYIE